MKTLLILIGTACLLAFSIFAQAGPPVSLLIGWTDPNAPLATVAYVYTNAVPDTNGGLYSTVTNQTQTAVSFPRPSTTYVYVRLGDANSNSTNYTALSEASNIIRVRVLGNGQVKVNTP